MSRLLIVSNRMPWNIVPAGDAAELVPAAGGLATGVLPWHERSLGKWVGWPGDASELSPDALADVERRLGELGMVAVHLSPQQVERYYHGFSNRVLWPLFHYLIDRVPVDATGWDAYEEVNRLFADIVCREYRAGDTIWVHDYQLMLLPELLRERLPAARIGFFLHIPFPSSEVFRTLPWRNRIMHGLLGADLIGFHTASYLRHFMTSILRVDGVEVEIDRIHVRNREVRLGVFPMGVDAARFSAAAEEPDVLADVAAFRRDSGGRAIVLGIDRLDYTKGITRRLEAIERLLTRSPELCDSVRYIQIAVPSREQVDSYQRFRSEVEERVGRINGTCATVRSTPIHYVHQSVSFAQLVALYRSADVMLVTPLRDGMNLVAKEFVASRPDGDGVLILSEFAGAAGELDGALMVNPYDIDGVAAAIQRALDMPAQERQARMSTMRRRVREYDLHVWASSFLHALNDVSQPASVPADAASRSLRAEIEAARARDLRVLLDYDGTLVPFAPSPELAAPDDELMALLDDLVSSEGISVDIVSGRPRETLEQWFGHLPMSLWAEHGFWSRLAGGAWTSSAELHVGWMDRIRPMLDHFTAATPGSFVEVKGASLAWHYRNGAPEFASRQAHELRMLLGDALRNQPFEVLEGRKVIEVRLRGVSKAVVAEHLRRLGTTDTIVAIGDDHTDEDLFRVLPAGSISISVGDRSSRARFVMQDHREVRRLLRSIVDMPRRSRVIGDRPPIVSRPQ